MPEHHDPIRLLEDFGTGGFTGTPADPADVRRLGDRRRARRRVVVMVAASVAATLAIGVPIALTRGGDGPHGPGYIATHGPQPSAPPSSPDSTPSPPADLTFPGNGVVVKARADLAELEGTSDAFRTFIGTVLENDRATCPTPEIDVRKYNDSGYAIGGVGGCGGYQALWVDRDGEWQEGMGTQDAWDCDALDHLGVPRSFPGECTDLAGDFGPSGTNGVDLGATQADLESAGGTVDPGPTGSCRTFVLPGLPAIANHTDGYLAPGQGVVMIAARPGMKTPERIGLGSSEEKVRQAYPNGRLSNGYWVVPLGHGTEYELGLGEHATVEEMLLADEAQPCTQ